MLLLLYNPLKTLKIIAPILFILILVLISARFILFISYIDTQKSEFRKASISGHAELKTLRFKASEIFKNTEGLRWEENNTELVLNGAYYDLKSIAVKNGIIVVILSSDEKENKSFEAFFNLNKKSNKLLFTLLQQFLNQTYLPGENVFNLKPSRSSTPINTDFLSILCQGHAHKIIKPPLSSVS